jgi:2-haloalkanoic acid dehalogenase type II
MLDFYGTVVHDDGPVFHSVCTAVAAPAGLSGPSSGYVAQRWYAEWGRGCQSSVGADFQSLRTLCRNALTDVLQDVDSDADPDELLAPLFASWRKPKLFSDAVKFLTAIDLPICIVSDVDRDDLAAALALHDLHFEHIVTSEDARSYKPRVEPFRLALDELGVDPTAVLHVGDSLANDILGAQEAGLTAMWLNREAHRVPAGTPVRQVSSLIELIPVLNP